jgi:hypothetical protein
MKNKREKKKMSSSAKALMVFLCFVLTIFFIALKGFSQPSEEGRRLTFRNPDIPVLGTSNSRHNERLQIEERLQSIESSPLSDEDSMGMISSGTLPEVGSWGYGTCFASFIHNNLLYVGTGRVIDILDVIYPSSPVKLGSAVLKGWAYSIFVEGNYACAAMLQKGIQVVDISNPASPVVMGAFDTGGIAWEVYVANSYAYVADDLQGLRIVDISNPSAPTEVGFLDTNGKAWGVYVSGNYAYVADYGSGLRIIDVSNPQNPTEVGFLDTPGYAEEVYVSGNYAYVADYNGGLRIIDVSVPTAPVAKGTFYGTIDEVYVSGNYAYTDSFSGSFQIINISNPSSPSKVGELTELKYTRDISISDNYAYVAEGEAGLRVIDISNRSLPVNIVFRDYPNQIESVHVSGPYAYCAGLGDGLRILDISNPAVPTPVGYWNTPWQAKDVFVSGDYAYVMDMSGDIYIVDVSNPSAPVQIGFWEAPTGGEAIYVVGNYAYLCTFNMGLRIVDVSNPASPVEVGYFITPGYNGDVHVSGSYAYVANWSKGLIIIDISNPASPVQVSSMSLSNGRGVFVNGSYAYLSCGTDFKIINVQDPANPSVVSTNSFDTYRNFVQGSYAFVVGLGTELHVYNVSNPASPTLVDSNTELPNPWSIYIVNGYAYVENADCGLSIVDVYNYTPFIRVTSPNGEEYWETGSNQVITWNSSGISGNVKIEYSTDNMNTWIEITPSTGNTGSFNWTIPSGPSDQCRLRISNSSGSISDTSDAVFTIAEPKTINLSAPNGSENWEGGTSQDITWNYTGDIDNVKIEFSTNNGSSWIVEVESTPNTGTYNWTVPNTPSSSCLVKVSDTASAAEDTSDAVFTIAELRTLALTAPNGGENWEGTTSQNITWTSTGSITNVKLEYSTNNGSSWNTITASTTNNGTYNWTVPNTPSTSCLVKVSDTAGPAADSSDAVFTIAAQRTLTITAPNGGENWEGTTVHDITWTSTGSITNVKLEYSTNNGSSWNTITASTTNSGSYNWTVPDTPSTTCVVRITDTASSATDTSDTIFTITAQRTITVTTPNGGQRWFIDSTYDITWSSTGSISKVMIEYSTNSGSSWTTITSSTSNTGTYNWTIPNTPSSNCQVRVSDTSGPAADVSNSVFTIDPYPTVTVTAPNGGETWIANTTHAITWTYTGTIAAVNLEYSTNNGTSWTSIATSVTNTGSYNWEIPYISSTNCLVRVSDTATTANDTSNAVFTIELPPSLTVTSPNGGESWVKRSTHTITWTWTGTVGNVKIQYTMNGGSSWTTITSSTANDGSHQWTLPNVTSNKTQCLVKIEAINGSAVDTSDAFFTILK